MTCIVGVEHKGRVWLGGDSAASDTYTINTRAEPKVWISGEFAFGFCDSFRFGALLRYSFKPAPVQHPIEKYWVTKFIPELRKVFKEDVDLRPEEDGKYPSIEFLIGLRGKLYCFHPDYQIARARDGFQAIGSGGEVAMGALYATKNLLQPRERLICSLTAAERYTTFVRAPFTIVKI